MAGRRRGGKDWQHREATSGRSQRSTVRAFEKSGGEARVSSEEGATQVERRTEGSNRPSTEDSFQGGRQELRGRGLGDDVAPRGPGPRRTIVRAIRWSP